MELYEKLLEIFDIGILYIILFVELIGVAVLTYTVIVSLISLIRHRDHTRLELAEGIALALEFKMGGELLRTVIVREWEELLILGAIVLLRAAMAFLIQWDIRIEKKQEEEQRLKRLSESEHKE